MKNHMKILLIIGLSFYFYFISYAQLNDSLSVITLSAQDLYHNRSQDEEKISSDLFYKIVYYLKETYKGESLQKVIRELKDDEFLTFDDQNRLLVFIRLKSNNKSEESQVLSLIQNNGGEIYNLALGHNNLSEITAYLPIKSIIKIAENDKTAFIKCPTPIFFH